MNIRVHRVLTVMVLSRNQVLLALCAQIAQLQHACRNFCPPDWAQRGKHEYAYSEYDHNVRVMDELNASVICLCVCTCYG